MTNTSPIADIHTYNVSGQKTIVEHGLICVFEVLCIMVCPQHTQVKEEHKAAIATTPDMKAIPVTTPTMMAQMCFVIDLTGNQLR